MFTDYVGKLLFPRLQPAEYRQKFKIVAATLLFGLVAGGLVAGVMILRGAVGK